MRRMRGFLPAAVEGGIPLVGDEDEQEYQDDDEDEDDQEDDVDQHPIGGEGDEDDLKDYENVQDF